MKIMFLDVGMGILSAIFVSWLFSVQLTMLFLTAGIIFSLLPDVDFIVHLIRGGTFKNAHRHRDLFHLPLVYIPLGMLISFVYENPLAVLFGIASLSHFLHDSIGIGWGVQWLWPLSKNHYKFLYNYDEKNKNKLIYVWKHGEIDSLAKKYGDENWFKNIYLNWSKYAIFEFAAFIISLIILFWYIK